MSLFSSVLVPATTKNWKADTVVKQNESFIWIHSKRGAVQSQGRQRHAAYCEASCRTEKSLGFLQDREVLDWQSLALEAWSIWWNGHMGLCSDDFCTCPLILFYLGNVSAWRLLIWEVVFHLGNLWTFPVTPSPWNFN